jgi:hypothetical protein
MTPLYEDPHFTFRFADDRIIPRFHLEGVEAGRKVSVFKINPDTGERLGLLATPTGGEGGWVDLTEPIIVKAGDAFIAVPEPVRLERSAGRILVNAMGVAGLFTIVGYLCGLLEGSENQLILAACFGAVGGLVSLLGYGPIALVIAGLDALSRWFQKRGR